MVWAAEAALLWCGYYASPVYLVMLGGAKKRRPVTSSGLAGGTGHWLWGGGSRNISRQVTYFLNVT